MTEWILAICDALIGAAVGWQLCGLRLRARERQQNSAWEAGQKITMHDGTQLLVVAVRETPMPVRSVEGDTKQ